MPYITVGTSSQLSIKAPTKGTTNWSSTMLTDTWKKIAEHNHDGAGNGVQLSAGSIAADAITGAKIRLDNNEALRARNQANSADVNLLKLDTNDELILQQTIGSAEFQDDGLTVVDNADNAKKIALDASAITTANTRTLTMADADVDLAALTNSNISASAAIDFSKLAALTSANVLVGNGSNVATSVAISGDITLSNAGVVAIASGVILNADINASAAIDASKIHDGSVSNTEFGYLNGVTSAIQTQIDGKLPTTITTTGDIIYSSSGSTASRLAIDSAGQVLQVSGGVPVWGTNLISPIAISSKTTNYTATTSDEHIEVTANSVTITLYSVTSNDGTKLTISNTGTGVVTVDPDGSETFNDGSTTKYLSQDQSIDLQSNGTEWLVKGFTTLEGYVKDYKAASDGGSATADTVHTRDLNTTEGDFTKFGSLSSNQFTLEPGTYILTANAPSYVVERHQLFLYDVTGTSYISEGRSCFSGSPADGIVATHAEVQHKWSITSSTAYEIRHYTINARATDGLGIDADGASNPNTNNLYTTVYIKKIV